MICTLIHRLIYRQPFNVIHPALEHLREMLTAADQVFLFVEIGTQRGAYYFGFWFVALAGDLLQPILHRPGDMHRQAIAIL